MMLPRKRQRPNPSASMGPGGNAPAASRPQPQPASTSPEASTSGDVPNANGSQMPPPNQGTAKKQQPGPKQVRKAQSWYGSWPRAPKAAASTSVARENILGGSVKADKSPDLRRFEQKRDGESDSIRSSDRGAPTMPRVPDNDAKGAEEAPQADQNVDNNNINNHDTSNETKDATKDETPSSKPKTEDISTPTRPATSSAWLGWWSKTPHTDPNTNPQAQTSPGEAQRADTVPRPTTPTHQMAQPDNPGVGTLTAPRSTSWFGLWSSNNTPSQTKSDSGVQPGASDTKMNDPQKNVSEDVTMEDAPPAPQSNPEPTPTAGSTWAFWSKDSPKTKGSPAKQESGEIAVIGEGSEAHPKPMTEDSVTPTKDSKSKKEAQSGGVLTWRRNNKRLRPPSMDIDSPSPSPSGASTPRDDTQPQGLPEIPQQPQPKASSSRKSLAESEIATKSQQNLLLPSFSSTYQMKQDPSIIKQIARLVLRTQESPVNHVFRVREPPRIRKAIAIGVHGLFPATYLRPMIGQPTGTSLRFASLCADAIRRWTDNHGSPDCEIEKVALEGEGKINERVENLWKLMLNWIEHIRQADLVVIACHSQGVPVSVMLLEKLIDLGIITNAKIGVCAMAGVALGPFPEYKSGILIGSAAELWDFGNPDSANSQRFEAALKRVLNYGTRITFIGSIDDQLVPMESAIYSPADHPYIYRAVFIDGRVHAPDFIAHLVGFALKLRNLGVSDHGLIRELSLPLAGSLYSGEGHSRLYYDDQVYDLAISHALETTTAPGRGQKHPECEIRHRSGQSSISSGQSGQNSTQGQQPNPYVLPWIMRGLLEEEFVRTELSQETEELLRQFDDWRPANKALKDVKYRLEAVRSKL